MKTNKGIENLIPESHVLTAEERSRGGVNSAQNKRIRRKASAIAEDILSCKLRAEDIPEGITVEDDTVISGIIAQLARKSLDGSLKACEMLLSLTGDYSKQMKIEAVTAVEDESLRLMEEYFARK